MNNFNKVTALALGAVAHLATAHADVIVYSNDFETNTNGFSTSGTTLLPTDNGGYSSSNQSTYLGKFAGNDSTDLTLTGLTPGQSYTVKFDLFIGNSWDGNSTNYGPDNFSLKVGSTALVNATFQNLYSGEASLTSFEQTYSDNTPLGDGGNFATLTGADVMFDGGAYTNRYGIYYFGHGAGNPVLTFTAGSASETLSFAGAGLQDVGDEFWAIDNVEVSTPVPTPEIWFSLTVGLGLLAVSRRSR